jgi:5'-3' exonuclease
MGIRCLNRFIQNRCATTSSRVHLKEFTGKRIAVDTSIYMYRYSGEGALLENMYLMGSVFRHYNIHAVFVFDGPPPPQKTDVIELRRKKKDEAKRQYDNLAKLIKEKKEDASSNVTTTEIDDITETMRELKKQFVRLRDCDIANVKELLVSFGFATIDAEGEADALCANLSIKRRVDACLSDDTDMFVYGCPVVLRNISLLNHSVVSYDMQEILKTLSLTQQEFKMMCVVCGTDYSNIHSTHSPDSVHKQLMKYKTLTHKEQSKYHDSGGGFYDWYASQPRKTPKAAAAATTATTTAATSKEKFGEIKSEGEAETSAITYISNESMFDVTMLSNGKPYKQLVVLNRENIQRKRIIEIMTKEDFIFIDSSPSDEVIIKSLSAGKTTLTSSPVYGICVESPEEQATMIAKEVYGMNGVSSFQELHSFHKRKRRESN